MSEAASVAVQVTFKKLQKQKTTEVDYHFLGHRGSMLRVNVASEKALSKVIGEHPFFFRSEREIYPPTTR